MKPRVIVRDMRSFPRKTVPSPTLIFDANYPGEEGQVCDISEKGLKVKGISSKVGENKAFMAGK